MKDLATQVAHGETELQRLDPDLGRLIKQQGTIVRQPRQDYFASLARSIIGQQLSVIAASRIYERFEALTSLDPNRVVELNEDQIKNIGLSRPKAKYIQDLARHFAADPAVYNHLENLSDDQVIAELVAIKGIGVWTAQMFLMFTLVRLDVFAPDDVGLQNALRRLYDWKELPSRAELERLAERWRPYRTIACWHLWASLHNEPT